MKDNRILTIVLELKGKLRWYKELAEDLKLFGITEQED